MIESILQFLEEGISLNFSFSKKGNRTIILVWPVIHGLEKSDIQPISIAKLTTEINDQSINEALKALSDNKISIMNIKTFENSLKKIEEEKKVKATGKKTSSKKVENKDNLSLNLDNKPIDKPIEKPVETVEQEKAVEVTKPVIKKEKVAASLDSIQKEKASETFLDPIIEKDDKIEENTQEDHNDKKSEVNEQENKGSEVNGMNNWLE